MRSDQAPAQQIQKVVCGWGQREPVGDGQADRRRWQRIGDWEYGQPVLCQGVGGPLLRQHRQKVGVGKRHQYGHGGFAVEADFWWWESSGAKKNLQLSAGIMVNIGYRPLHMCQFF